MSRYPRSRIEIAGSCVGSIMYGETGRMRPHGAKVQSPSTSLQKYVDFRIQNSIPEHFGKLHPNQRYGGSGCVPVRCLCTSSRSLLTSRAAVRGALPDTGRIHTLHRSQCQPCLLLGVTRLRQPRGLHSLCFRGHHPLDHVVYGLIRTAPSDPTWKSQRSLPFLQVIPYLAPIPTWELPTACPPIRSRPSGHARWPDAGGGLDHEHSTLD